MSVTKIIQIDVAYGNKLRDGQRLNEISDVLTAIPGMSETRALKTA